MSRHLTKVEEEGLGRFAQKWDRFYLSLLRAPIAEKIPAIKRFEKRSLKEMRTATGKRQVQRRITKTLLMETRSGPWRRFSPYLRRMERLGFSSMDDRLLVCGWAAQAARGSQVGLRRTAALIADFERRARIKPPHPAAREQIEFSLERAKSLIGLGSEQAPEEPKRRKKPKARGRRSVE
ncbi:hypothetical protein BO221_21595 [Archangium sp. Cb G35]|uniref:hypothetical protein n=1 Tax=Archangium sp. Cb G35 TaxID=1920190 RepID=UPI000936233B|nr:hypothetical protein [Archangium sp. Cb G35]OJT22386.1 hypothetical protein BO221_21595 [Archangium sp. Cb G35]